MPHSIALPALAGLRTNRWLRLALWTLVAVLVFWLLSWLLITVVAKGPLERKASALLGRPVSIGAIEFTPWTLELTVRQLSVGGLDGAAPQLEIERIYADLELQSVLRLGPVVDAITIDKPHLRIALLGDGHYDVDDILARLAKPADAPPSKPARMALYNLALNSGAVEVEDRRLKTTHTLHDLTLAIPFISTLPSQRTITIAPQMSFDLEGSRFSSTAQATPFTDSGNGVARVQWQGLDLKPYLAYLPASLPAVLQSALLDLDMTLAFEQRPETALKISGTATAKGVKVADRQGASLLSWKTLTVDLAEVKPLARSAHIARVTIEQPMVHAARSEDGALNWSQLSASGAKPAADSTTTETVAADPNPNPNPNPKPKADAGQPWAVSVDEIALRKGHLLWADASTQPAASLEAQDIDVTVRDLAIPFKTLTAKAPGKPLSFDGSLGLQAGSLAFKGQATDQKAEVSLSLQALPLTLAQPYLAAFLEPALTGTLAGNVAVQWDGEAAHQSPGATGVQLTAGPLALSQLALTQGKNTLASLQSLNIDGALIDLDARRVKVERLALVKPQTSVERTQDGQWSFARWKKPAAALANAANSAETKPATATASATPKAWQIRIADAALQGGSLAFTDRMQTRPVALQFSEMQLHAGNVALDGSKPEALEFSSRIAAVNDTTKTAPGTLKYQGTLTPQPLAAAGKIDASQLPLHALDGYFADKIAIELLRADADFKGDATFAQGAGGPTVRLAGDAAVDNMRANSTAASTVKTAPQVGQQLLAWKSLGLRGLSVALAPDTAPRIEVKETSLSDFFARVTIDETGTINLTQLTQKPAVATVTPKPAKAAQTKGPSSSAPAAGEASASDDNTAAASAPASAPSAPAAPANPLAAQFAFGPLNLVNGTVAFSDFFIQPNYSADLTELTGTLGGFTSQSAGGAPVLADLQLRGKAEGSASLDITGKLNPLAQPLALDIQGKVRDLELPPLSPYSVKFAGHGIERGKLSMDVTYQILPNGQLTARNKLVLRQLRFGEAVPGAPNSLPVKLAVALLADSRGVIDLDLPISGSLNDPQFKIGPVIFKAIANLVGKALTSPFSLLASAFGGGEAPSSVAFAPGSAVLSAEAQASLGQVAKAVADRPALSVTVTGSASLAAEAEALQRERLKSLVRAEQPDGSKEPASAAATNSSSASAAGSSGTGPDNADKTADNQNQQGSAATDDALPAAEYARQLQQLYTRTDMPKPRNLVGLAQPLSVPEMEALLLAHLPAVTESQARALARERAQVVRRYLLAQKLPDERLFVGAPTLATGSKDWKPQAELSLAAK